MVSSMTFLTADVPATIENMKDISSTEDLKDIAETATTDIKTGAFQKWIEGMMPSALSFFWSVVIALIAWFIGVRIINLVRGIVRRSFIRHEVEEGVRTFVDSLLRIVLYISLIIVILNIFGFETTSVSAAVASLGVTIGLAMQGSLSNFAGGVLILVLHPFRVGDYIVEDSHGNEGTVQSISIFYTKLVTLDNRVVVIPNGTLANSSLTNVTECDFRMIDLTVGIAYSADLRKAKEILSKLVEEEEGRIADKPSSVFVRELNSSSVDLGYRFYVKMSDYWKIRWDMNEKIKLAFDEAGIEIPFPQLTIHNGDPAE